MLVEEEGAWVVGIEAVRFRVERGIFAMDWGLEGFRIRLGLLWLGLSRFIEWGFGGFLFGLGLLESSSKLNETTFVWGVLGLRGVFIRLRLWQSLGLTGLVSFGS